MIFQNRKDAGEKLAEQLASYADRKDVVVLAIPRGGVPVGAEVARALGVPLDIFIVRKLGVPGQEELAFGAIASGGVRVLNDDVVRMASITSGEIESVTEREKKELERRERVYRGGRAALEVKGKTVLLVDDGIATGSSMRAGIAALRQHAPARIIVATPVAPATTRRRLGKEADGIVCVCMPETFHAIGQFYEDFLPTGDDEVCTLLEQTRPAAARAAGV